MTIFNYTLLKALRNPLTLIFNCVLPILLVFIRPLWEGEGMMTGHGLLIFIVWAGTFLMAQGILRDRESGALTRILAAPISMRNYLTQNLLAYMVPLTLQIMLITIMGKMLYSWTATFSAGLFLALAVFTVTSVAMSFAWNCLFKTKDSSFMSFSALITFGTMLSDAFVPLEFFPDSLQYVGAIFPAWWAMRAINSLSELGTMGADFWTGIAALILFALVFLLYGGKRRMI